MAKKTTPAFPLPIVTFKTHVYEIDWAATSGSGLIEQELTGEVMILNINSGTMRVRVPGHKYPFDVPCAPFFEQHVIVKKEQ
jgi:hypothetical protein